MAGSRRPAEITADARQEAILTALAKLEHTLRERSRASAVRAEDAQRHRKPSGHAYYSGVADGYLDSALAVKQAYKTAVMVGGDPLVR